MHTRLRLGIPLLMAAVFVSACDEAASDLTDPGHTITPDALVGNRVGSVPADVCGEAVPDLIAAGGGEEGFPVGAVRIANDETTLYVSYRTSDGWAVRETHLAVTASPADIPKPGKQVVPGKFPHSDVHDPVETVVHYAIPLTGDLASVDPLIVAAHADVVKGTAEEGAWMGGEMEVRQGGNWATYHRYDLASCEPQASGEFGPDDGGELTLSDATLTVPSGALGGTETLTMEEVDAGNLPSGALPGTAYDLGPEGQTFLEPVTLRITYDDTGLALADEEDLAIHLLNAAGLWERIEPTLHDLTNNILEAELEHFSVYAVVPGHTRLEIRNVEPQPVPENERLEHEVWIWNISSDPYPTDWVLEATVTGPIDGWAYSTGECSLSSNGDVHTFICDNLANPPEPGTAKVEAFNAYPASGSAGQTIEISAQITAGGQAVAVGGVSTTIAPPNIEADLTALADAIPNPATVGAATTITGDFVNQGPADAGEVVGQFEVTGEFTFDPVQLPVNCTADHQGTHLSISCGFGPTPEGTGAHLSFDVIPTAGGEISVSAEIEDVSGLTVDPDFGNNTSSVEVFVQ